MFYMQRRYADGRPPKRFGSAFNSFAACFAACDRANASLITLRLDAFRWEVVSISQP